jgi:hypothetical protein
MPQFTGSTFSKYTSKGLIGTGVFELVLAAGFVVGGIAAPDARGALFLTAAILGLVGIVLVSFGMRSGRKAAETERIDETGIAGVATITGLTQTGMFLNENPQVVMDLSVSLGDRPPYEVKHQEFVPLIMLGQLSAGAQLPVKVDPADPQKAVIEWGQPVQAPTGWFAPTGAAATGPGTAADASAILAGLAGSGLAAAGGIPAGAAGAATPGGGGSTENLSEVQAALQSSGLHAANPFTFAEQGSYTVEQLRTWLHQNGLQGTATIDKLEDSGKTVGNDHLYTMQVTLNVPGHPPIQDQPSAAMVPKEAVSKVAVGRAIPIRVAPDNFGMLMFEWEKLV